MWGIRSIGLRSIPTVGHVHKCQETYYIILYCLMGSRRNEKATPKGIETVKACALIPLVSMVQSVELTGIPGV